MSNTPQTEQPSTTLPMVAIVFFVLFWPIGLVLSIISIVKYGSATGSTAKTLSTIAVVINLCLGLPLCGVSGVMAAIAIPNFVKFQCRAKQSEAKGNLKSLYVSEESFRAEHDRYDSDLGTLEFTPKGKKIRYVYTVLSADKEHFSAEARGIDEMQGDLWTISDRNDLEHVENSCN